VNFIHGRARRTSHGCIVHPPPGMCRIGASFTPRPARIAWGHRTHPTRPTPHWGTIHVPHGAYRMGSFHTLPGACRVGPSFTPPGARRIGASFTPRPAYIARDHPSHPPGTHRVGSSFGLTWCAPHGTIIHVLPGAHRIGAPLTPRPVHTPWGHRSHIARRSPYGVIIYALPGACHMGTSFTPYPAYIASDHHAQRTMHLQHEVLHWHRRPSAIAHTTCHAMITISRAPPSTSSSSDTFSMTAPGFA